MKRFETGRSGKLSLLALVLFVVVLGILARVFWHSVTLIVKESVHDVLVHLGLDDERKLLISFVVFVALIVILVYETRKDHKETMKKMKENNDVVDLINQAREANRRK